MGAFEAVDEFERHVLQANAPLASLCESTASAGELRMRLGILADREGNRAAAQSVERRRSGRGVV